MLKALSRWFKGTSTTVLLGVPATAVAIYFILLWRLGNLTPGLSPAEVASRTASTSLHNIYANSINAPSKIIQHLLTQLSGGGYISLRLGSVIFAIIFGFCFYKLSAGLFGRMIGIFSSLFFISLPIFVITARQGSAEIMFFSPVALMWLYAWLTKKDSRKPAAWLAFLTAGALLIYVPGMVWWMTAGLILCHKRIIRAISSVPSWLSAVALALAAGLITPLIISIVHSPRLLKSLALVPNHWDAPLQIVKNISWMVSSLFIETPGTNPLIVGRLPIFNVLLIALLVFGVYAMRAAARTKTYVLGLNILFAVLVAGINFDLSLLALGIPAAMIFISAGLRYLYIEWRAIFPKNPVPKNFALVLIAAVTATQLYFGLRYSLAAWPHSAATRNSYVLK